MIRIQPFAVFPLVLLLAVACDEQGARETTTTTPQDSSTAAEAEHAHAAVSEAVCVMRAVGESGVEGVVTFEASDDGSTTIRGRITGLTPGEHGFHVHEFGDLRDLDAGQSAGSHFAPHGSAHGRREDAERHAGDLGNIEADEAGVAEFEITDSVVKLHGPDSILGRSLVVHERADDFSQPVGNAGGRVGLGVIGVAKEL